MTLIFIHLAELFGGLWLAVVVFGVLAAFWRNAVTRNKRSD